VGAVGFAMATGASGAADRDAVAAVPDPDTAGATLLSAGKRKGRAAFTIARTNPANADPTTRKLNHASFRGFFPAGSSCSSEI
jgi:hypothetical protein